MRSLSIAGAVFVSLALCASTSQAGTIATFQGQDDGAAVGGPFPNSAAAQAAFEAAAAGFGATNTITYEGLALGYYTPIVAAPGVSIALTGPNDGNQVSGISNTTLGNLYGFNTTPGGSYWLGFADGTATFTFATPTNSFGTWMTGLQTVFTAQGVLTITFNDGATQILAPTVNVNGGAQYFGFTDTTAFSSVTISNISFDAWGIDDTTYNGSNTPEPASFTLLGVGLVGLLVRRRLHKRAA